MGRCPECGQWDTLVEEKIPSSTMARSATGLQERGEPVPIDRVTEDDEQRLLTGIGEFDRVLGGGIVPGTLVLIGGDPGIGKSTLMLQVLHSLATRERTVLYVSGEESVRQLRLRSRRLGTLSPRLLVVSEIAVEAVLAMVESLRPDVVVVDSIQTMFSGEFASAPGSVSQVREATLQLMLLAKRSGVPVFLVGHVTKDGTIAGPRLLEHMVDTVLYFEGDGNHLYRVLRAVKNRFGSTNEIGVFEMQERGLKEVANPSSVFLSERPAGSPGSVVTASVEGTRPILVEIQALVSSASQGGNPRRTILGLDRNRVALLVAVMEKKLGLPLMGHDIFMNVAGGVRVEEPAVDLGIVAAVASSFLDKPLQGKTVVLGEVGLTGEVRAIGQIEARLAESGKMGFTRCLLPQGSMPRNGAIMEGMALEGVHSLSQAMELLF